MSDDPKSSEAFVDGLVAEMSELFGRLGDSEALESESEGRVDVATLLRLALSSELEAAEIAGLWLPTTPEIDVKAMFARQAADEMKHYQLISRRLAELGEPVQDEEAEETYSPLYQYLTTLRTTVERIAAGPFAREAIAEVRNAQFIELCHRCGDEQTATLYVDIIQPEEIEHNRAGRELLIKYAISEEDQRLATNATRNSLAIADELRTLTQKTTGLQAIPAS